MNQPVNSKRPQGRWGRGKMAIARGGRLTLASALVLSVATVAFTAGPVEVSAEESPVAALLGGTGPLAGAIFEAGDNPDYRYVDDVLATLAEAQARPAEQQQAAHWNPAKTAKNNGGALQGDALELTWSIIPDGTLVIGHAGEPDCNSTLVASLNAAYGPGNWQAEMEKVWDDWTQLSGNVYTPAVPLDANGTPLEAAPAATWGLDPSSPGLDGVRGDIRIGGCYIDGASGTNTLAYNFFPNNGDMKIDTDNLSGLNLTTEFHNIFSHEHGHGAGLSHVCPVNQTKLMEPFLSSAYTGLQHDDIRGVQRGYGDRFETINAPNDTIGAATALDPLTPPGGQTELQLSLDSTSDEDWFQFSGIAGNTLDVSVAPNGLSYLEGPVENEACGAGTTLNSLALQDLSFEIRNAGGVLRVVDATSAGSPESTTGFVIPTTGTYYVRVLGTGTDDAQLYDLTVNETTSVAAVADLSITKSDSADPVLAGLSFTYTITVQNIGRSTATNVVVADTLPTGVTLTKSIGCNQDPDGTPTCSLGAIESGATKSFTVTVTVDRTTSGTISNTATVATDTTDPNPANNSATETTTILSESIGTGPQGIVRMVAAGGNHTCALLNTSSLTCWGYDGYGQLGNGITTGNITAPSEPITLPTDTTASAITAGYNHTCALLNTGNITCWGRDNSGQLGNGTTTGDITTPPDPITLPTDTTATAITAGDNHTCALLNTGNITCWGNDTSGQLGNGNTTGNITAPPDPITLPTDTTATAITAGDNHTCALLNTGNITCWGWDGFGQLGNGITTGNITAPSEPITLPTDTTATAITAGDNHTCALLNTGNITCWGNDSCGQLGNGTTTGDITAPPDPITLPTDTTATAITAGDNHTCALLNTGNITCWGNDTSGQLGNGTHHRQHHRHHQTPSHCPPTRPPPAITAGDNHTCALLNTDNITCWGNDGNGQLGNGNTTGNLTEPSGVIGVPTVSIVAGTTPTNGVVEFTATFNQTVLGFDDPLTDVVVTTATGGTATITPTGATGTYTITAAGMTSDGDIAVTIPTGAANSTLFGLDNTAAPAAAAITYDTTSPVATVAVGRRPGRRRPRRAPSSLQSRSTSRSPGSLLATSPFLALLARPQAPSPAQALSTPSPSRQSRTTAPSS